MYAAGLMLWALVLIGAAFYARRAGHPAASPLDSYLIFITVFTVAALVNFAGGALALQAIDALDALQHPLGIAFFLGLVLVPAAIVARWQMRQPPSRPRPL